MNLEDRLPGLLHYPWDDPVPPISATAVIARARRRRARRRLAAGTGMLALVTGTALLAGQLMTRTAPDHQVAARSPVRTVALKEHLAVAGAQLWLESVEACVHESAGWLWDPIGITGPTNCALYRNARLSANANASPAFYEAMGVVDTADKQTMPLVGTYTGPTPASIVISSGNSSAVATLVTSPQLHAEFGFYAYLHYPLPPGSSSTANGNGNGNGSGTDFHLTLGPSITLTAYDDTGGVLATVTWPGVSSR